MLKGFALGAASLLVSAATAVPIEIKLVNPSFEEPANGARAPGWFPSQHTGPVRNYEWAVDATDASEGKASYRKIGRAHV